MFPQIVEQDTSSINTLPSIVSETESNDVAEIHERTDSVLFVINDAHSNYSNNCTKTCFSQLTNLLCQKVSLPQNAAKLLKKSKTSSKYKKLPLTFFQVVICGIILIFLILCCIIIETWWRMAPKNNSMQFIDSKVGYQKHSVEERKYHEQIVQEVNSNPKAKWKAQYNKFAYRATNQLVMDKELLQLALKKNIEMYGWSKSQMFADTESQLRYLSSLRNFTLPKKFDARFRWPECSSINKVVNQGSCGSCWAMSATSVMSDRICVHSNASKQPLISAQDLIECCRYCGGCRGTIWALFSFYHWKEHGIVTGSDYGSFVGCKPYEESPSCGSPCSIEIYNAKKGSTQVVCSKTCNSLYDKTYQQDLHFAKKVYWVKPNVLNNVIYGETMSRINNVLIKKNVNYEVLIKRELLLNGPMIGCFIVYDEFQHYKSGIYESMTSPNTKKLYGHCAKLIGWGKDSNGNQFWTYMNTWGASWGENGFFRVAIKEIPEEAAAGLPLL